MAEAAVMDVECGFCLQRNAALEDARSLPCTHVHCFGCLVDNYNIRGIVQCPACSQVFDIALDSLPSTDPGANKSTCCDSCTRKGVYNQPAEIYCSSCSEKFCFKHKESHNDIFGHHPNISINEYKVYSNKLDPRLCTEHAESPYIISCRSCLTVICVECIADLDPCKDDAPHKLMSLNKLAKELTVKIEEMRAALLEKEEQLSALFKQTSKILSDYDSESKTMIEILHQACEKQVKAIKLKYTNLEKEMLQLRENVKTDVTRFMEEDVGRKWHDLSSRRQRIEARLLHSHQVDVVIGFEEIANEIKTLTSEELPTLELRNMMSLEVTDLEGVKILFPRYGCIDLQHGLTMIVGKLPKSMTLLSTVLVPALCTSVCRYQGNTYVGLNNGHIVKIDENNQRSQPFLTFGSFVFDISVHKNQLYSLVHGSPYTVNTNDLTGKLITKWNHSDGNNKWYTKFAILENQIVIPDRENNRLTVYSHTGEIIKHLPCDLFSKKTVGMCAAAGNSVIVSDCDSSQVFKMNIPTGEVCWISTCVNNPQGVTYYEDAVYVTNKSTTTTVWILNGKTGKMMEQIVDPTVRTESSAVDLYVSERTLIVPRRAECKVLFYQLD